MNTFIANEDPQWIELGGGRYNTIADAETLRDELLKAVYGVWDHIKNGGEHGAQNMELEWVGMLPGKRESRRLMGDYVLNEADCAGGRRFADAVAYGGWPMDVHTVEGFLNDSDDPTVWLRLEDVYTIPYRCYYSRNIPNLFLCGRIISASHMAFASARVMATCAVGGQAVGTAAAIAVHRGILPREVGAHIRELQQTLLRDDCYIPGIRNEDADDLLRDAQISASHALPECEAENVLSGVSRTVGEQTNCWAAYAADHPTLTLRLAAPAAVRRIQLTFDSNLSREITISINREVLGRQSAGTPPELVCSCRLVFVRDGADVRHIDMKDFGKDAACLTWNSRFSAMPSASRISEHTALRSSESLRLGRIGHNRCVTQYSCFSRHRNQEPQSMGEELFLCCTH